MLDDLEKLNGLVEPPFKQSKEEIWGDLASALKAGEKTIAVYPYRRYLWRAAAVVALLIGLTVVFRFYPLTVRAPQEEVAHLTLPDGSSVVLNKGSVLTYYPLWWKVSARVTLTGEAFFSGKHAKGFSVQSVLGTVTVLGTRFDVYARRTKYSVVCFSGKVKVTSLTRKRMILTSGEKAEVGPSGEITFSKNIPLENYAWTRQQFVFTAMPLHSVFHALEKYYHVKIILQKQISSTYSGNFSTKIPVEQALNIVCKPFGLTFVKTGNRIFVVQ